MKRTMIFALAMLFGGIVLAADAKPAPQKYQALFLASLVDGWCHAKQQTGQTTVSAAGKTTTTPALFTEEEKNQCNYVRMGLANKCFERGTCPKYEVWLKTRLRNR